MVTWRRKMLRTRKISSADAEWRKVKVDPEISGALPKHIDSYFMDRRAFRRLNRK